MFGRRRKGRGATAGEGEAGAAEPYLDAQDDLSDTGYDDYATGSAPESGPYDIDEVDEEGAIGRSYADAPEIDGNVFLNGETGLKPGDLVDVTIEHADEYDLWGSVERADA